LPQNDLLATVTLHRRDRSTKTMESNLNRCTLGNRMYIHALST